MGNKHAGSERIDASEGSSPASGSSSAIPKPLTQKQKTNRLLDMLRRSERLMWMEVGATKDANAEYPPARNSQGTCFFQDSMYIYGGRSPDGRLNDLWVFRCETRTWRCLERNDDPMGPIIRSGCLLVHDGSHSLYVGFGYDRNPVPHSDLYRYDLYERTWTLLHPANDVRPPARINFRGWFYGDCVWLFGGSPDGTQCFGDLWKYDIHTNVWTQPATSGEAPPPCQWSAIELWKGSKVVLFGGHHDTGLPARTFHIFDCDTLHWESLMGDAEPVIEGLHKAAAAAVPSATDAAAALPDPMDLGADDNNADNDGNGHPDAEAPPRRHRNADADDEDPDDGIFASWQDLMCSSPASAIMRDRLMLWGGWDGRVHRNTLWSVDLNTRVWEVIRPRETNIERPQPRGSASAIVWNNLLFLFGGWNGWSQVDSMHAVSFEFPTLQRLCLEQIATQRSKFPDDLDLSMFEASLMSPTSFAT